MVQQEILDAMSRVITDDEQTQELVTTPRAVEETLPAESQFVPLHKDKPLFLETQTQFETAQDLQDDVEPDTQLDNAQVDEDVDDDVEMQVTEAIVQEGPKETIQVRAILCAESNGSRGLARYRPT